MTKYDQVRNDKKIIELYNNISAFEDLNKAWAHHDFRHVKNVAKLVGNLLDKLGYGNEFIEEAKIAAILHDTGAIQGKTNHSKRSYEFAKKYFETNNIILQNKELVLEAIKIHSDGFDSDNIIALTLILADKLDITYTRVAKEGYKINGMKELQFIKKILVDLNDKNLRIQFVCTDKINRSELEEFYFTLKVLKSISNFCEKNNLIPIVLLNNSKWKLFDDMFKIL